MHWVQIKFRLLHLCRKDYLFGSILSVCGTSQKLIADDTAILEHVRKGHETCVIMMWKSKPKPSNGIIRELTNQQHNSNSLELFQHLSL